MAQLPATTSQKDWPDAYPKSLPLRLCSKYDALVNGLVQDGLAPEEADSLAAMSWSGLDMDSWPDPPDDLTG